MNSGQDQSAGTPEGFPFIKSKALLGGITLLFGSRIIHKTVKELRKNQNLTTKELAAALKLDTVDILNIDNLKLKDVPEPLKSKLLPILSGDYMDKIPWL
jgi:hypothetical protein